VKNKTKRKKAPAPPVSSEKVETTVRQLLDGKLNQTGLRKGKKFAISIWIIHYPLPLYLISLQKPVSRDCLLTLFLLSQIHSGRRIEVPISAMARLMNCTRQKCSRDLKALAAEKIIELTTRGKKPPIAYLPGFMHTATAKAAAREMAERYWTARKSAKRLHEPILMTPTLADIRERKRRKIKAHG
jgi:hypothetical protein